MIFRKIQDDFLYQSQDDCIPETGDASADGTLEGREEA